MQVKIQKIKENAKLPIYSSHEAAGADLYACVEQAISIAPQQTVVIPTGIAIQLPIGTVGLVYARSGLATKLGLAPANKVGVIDSDYRGEILVALYNHGEKVQTIEPQDRIAQLVVTPYITATFEEVEHLSTTVRGVNGFGSTGKK